MSTAPDHAEQMRRNAAEQAAALDQDPGGADRDALLAARMREKITSGLAGERTTHPDAAWFGQCPLGLFIHWGIPSVRGDLDLSWAMIANLGRDAKVTPREYWALADRFRAENYDPSSWLRPARAAGFDYAVLTAKHHDGYALWPTDTTDLGVRTHLGGRDLVGEYVAACRASGLRVGLYFSGPDWWLDRAYRNFNYRSPGGIGNSSLPPIPGRVAYDLDHRPWDPPAAPPALLEENRARCRRQLVELLTRYGKIDILWFDGGCGSDISIEEIRALQPGIVVNNRGNCRWHASPEDRVFPGDFYTVEFGEAPARPPGWWEQLRIWNEPCWGYTRANENHYAPADDIAAQIRRTRAWDGAYLLNVGPRPDGTLPDPYHRGLEQLARLPLR
ncbi:MAG: alpha-L-fucosidase [Opitutaceae bacterium]|nr:alpha-L-fucosidase [Opitutaceae bacterium]